MDNNRDTISADRTDGGRGNVGVNPSVVHFTTDLTSLSDQPTSLKLSELRNIKNLRVSHC